MPPFPEDPPSWAADVPLLGIAAGFALLLGGANLLVRGAVWIALVLGLSRMAVGLTLVAFGTSLPELLVSLASAFKGENDIALANVLGSNTMNVLLIVGLTACIRPIHTRVDRLELGHMLAATALVALPFALQIGLGRALAAAMFAHIVFFCWQLMQRERRQGRQVTAGSASAPRANLGGWLANVFFLAVGLALLGYGAGWLVDGAKALALDVGMSDKLVGATIVAGGTSLPELATSAVAARRGHPEIAIGNVLGSNIFNVGSVLGLCGLIHPIPIDHATMLALLLATVASALWLAGVLHLRGAVGRTTGACFLLAWAGYVAFEAGGAGG